MAKVDVEELLKWMTDLYESQGWSPSVPHFSLKDMEMNLYGMAHEQKEIKIRYEEGMHPVYQAHEGEWFDLRAGVTIRYMKGNIVKIPLGVAMKLPKGYEAIVRPRSSISRRKGLVFADSGVIDNAYCGNADEWGSTWYAVEDGIIYKNERICQFRIQRIQDSISFEKVDFLEDPNRGGYGSTGT